MAVHRVVHELVSIDRGRRGHLTVWRLVPPQDRPEPHRDRMERALEVADVRDSVVDHRRELDQPAERYGPDRAERRPQPDVLLGLRSRRSGAVDRPLELRAVDAHGHVPELHERLVQRP